MTEMVEINRICPNILALKLVIRGILTGLQHLHSIGIVHKDIKPDNILVDALDPSNVKIIDFNISELCFEGETTKRRSGSVFYMAPEVFRAKPHNNKCDMWSLGVLTYFSITGEYPFYA